MIRNIPVGPRPGSRLGARSKFHDKVVGPGGKTSNKLRKTRVGPGTKGLPYSEVDIEELRTTGEQAVDQIKQKCRRKFIAILSLILEKKGE